MPRMRRTLSSLIHAPFAGLRVSALDNAGDAVLVCRLLACAPMKQARSFLPLWALQFVIGMFAVLLAVGLFAALVGSVVRGPQTFFDEVGKTVARIAPQPQADVRSDAALKAVIKALPDGRLRVASVVADQDRVVFTVTADRAAVKAAVQSGDELRLSRTTGEIEIVPTGLPGLVDRLQQAIEDLRRSWFGK